MIPTGLQHVSMVSIVTDWLGVDCRPILCTSSYVHVAFSLLWKVGLYKFAGICRLACYARQSIAKRQANPQPKEKKTKN